MNIIMCLDDRNGLTFNGRRLSTDRLVYQQITKTAAGNLWMNQKSAELFNNFSVCTDVDFLNRAEFSDSCFVEDLAFIEHMDKVRLITIYRWNRRYPSDVRLPENLLTGWKCISTFDFAGNSHETITEEKYVP